MITVAALVVVLLLWGAATYGIFLYLDARQARRSRDKALAMVVGERMAEEVVRAHLARAQQGPGSWGSKLFDRSTGIYSEAPPKPCSREGCRAYAHHALTKHDPLGQKGWVDVIEWLCQKHYDEWVEEKKKVEEGVREAS